MERNHNRNWLGLGLLAVVLMAGSAMAQYDVPGDFATIQEAINAAPAGATVNVADGIYNPAGSLTITQSVSLVGQSEAGVTINIPAAGGYGIIVTASDVVLQNFTLAANADNQNYPIHASGTSNPPSGFDNLTISQVTISGSHRRTGFDIHGYNNVVLSNLTSSDAYGGNGLQVTGCVGVDMDNITTTSNAWGSIAIYSSSSTYLNRGSDDVYINGPTCSLGEQNIFNQDEFGLFNTNIVVDGYGYIVRSAALAGYWLYQDTEANAVALALVTPGAYIMDLGDDSLLVVDGLSIQAAIDGAGAGDTVNVGAGVYREQLSITKDLSLVGAGMDLVTVEAPDAVDRASYTITTWTGSTKTVDAIIGVNTAAGTVAVTGLTVDGRETGPSIFYGVHFYNTSGSVTSCRIDGVTNPAVPGAQEVVSIMMTQGLNPGIMNLNISNNVIPDFQKGGISILGPDLTFTVNNNVITGTISNSIAGNGIQLSYGATGSTLNNEVSNIGYTGDLWAASGILLFESGDISMSGDEVNNCERGVSYNNWGGWGYLSPVAVNLDFEGLVLANNTWSFETLLGGDDSDLNLTMTDCTISGSTSDAVDIWGNAAYSNLYPGWSNGDLNVSITGLTLIDTGFDGIWTADIPATGTNTVHSFNVSNSSFTNTTGGAINNTFDFTIIAEGNFWDSLTGPLVGLKAGGVVKKAAMIQPIGFEILDRGGLVSRGNTNADKAAETVIGPVDFSPWYGLPLETSPMTIGTSDSIQDAIDLAFDGDTVNVAAGHYEEQVHITQDDLTLNGAGVDVTYIDSPVNLPLFYATSVNNYPVVFVDGCTDLNMSGFTVDGLGRGNANYRFQGVGFWNAGGALSTMNVTNITETPFSGNQHCVGVYAYNNTGGPYTIVMSDVLVDGYQKSGVVLGGEGLAIDVDNVTTVGVGPTAVTAQNGIQVGYGATGTMDNCNVTGNHYSGPTWWASGVLLYDNGMVTMTGCNVDASQGAISVNNGNAAISGGTITNSTGNAIGAYSWAAKSASGKHQAQPVAEDFVNGDKMATAVTVSGVTMVGGGAADDWGVEVWTDDQIDFTMTSSSITGFDYGLVLTEDAGGVITGSASGNTMADNTTYGAFSNTVAPFDARGNWWGAASGPLHATLNPGGTGNEVSDFVLFEPWVGQSFVTAEPAASGPLTCGQTVTVTFKLTVDAYTPDVFGYNAIVRSTSEVVAGDITNELSQFGIFQVFDQLDGSFNIASSTVGAPTYPITEAGTYDLFSIDFLTSGDGTAAITFDSFSLRDPNNAPIAASASGATIEVDCTAPAAVTGVTAVPHHNRVEVSWTHDGSGVTSYLVYRGLAYDTTAGETAYPEYDDLIGYTEPTREASPALATASAEWELAGTIPVGTSTMEDNAMADRGIYFYEVFAVDNAGPVANFVAGANTDAATNYWLGDVSGDGNVDILGDIGFLGNAFGTVEGGPLPEDANYNADCDVGPTDNWSRVGLPDTDSRINFEDLMIFSMNFGVVSDVNKAPTTVATAAHLAWVSYDEGRYALRLIDGAGLKGVRLTANLPEGVIGDVIAGDLLDQQSEMTFLKNVGTGLDVNLAVMGTNNGFTGSGDLFIVTSSQPIGMEDISIQLRGADNSAIEVSLDTTSDSLTPRAFALGANYPNPFNPMTKISFSLPEAQNVKLVVYSLDGRKVATLVNETRQAGLHEVLWTGRNDAGQGVASGTYFYRIDAGQYSQVRKMTLMK